MINLREGMQILLDKYIPDECHLNDELLIDDTCQLIEKFLVNHIIFEGTERDFAKLNIKTMRRELDSC